LLVSFFFANFFLGKGLPRSNSFGDDFHPFSGIFVFPKGFGFSSPGEPFLKILFGFFFFWVPLFNGTPFLGRPAKKTPKNETPPTLPRASVSLFSFPRFFFAPGFVFCCFLLLTYCRVGFCVSPVPHLWIPQKKKTRTRVFFLAFFFRLTLRLCLRGFTGMGMWVGILLVPCEGPFSRFQFPSPHSCLHVPNFLGPCLHYSLGLIFFFQVARFLEGPIGGPFFPSSTKKSRFQRGTGDRPPPEVCVFESVLETVWPQIDSCV